MAKNGDVLHVFGRGCLFLLWFLFRDSYFVFGMAVWPPFRMKILILSSAHDIDLCLVLWPRRTLWGRAKCENQQQHKLPPELLHISYGVQNEVQRISILYEYRACDFVYSTLQTSTYLLRAIDRISYVRYSYIREDVRASSQVEVAQQCNNTTSRIITRPRWYYSREQHRSRVDKR